MTGMVHGPRTVVHAGAGGRLAATDVTTGATLWEVSALTPLVRFVAGDPAAEHLLTVGADRSTVRWDPVTGRPLAVHDVHQLGAATGLGVLPDGTAVVASRGYLALLPSVEPVDPLPYGARGASGWGPSPHLTGDGPDLSAAGAGGPSPVALSRVAVSAAGDRVAWGVAGSVVLARPDLGRAGRRRLDAPGRVAALAVTSELVAVAGRGAGAVLVHALTGTGTPVRLTPPGEGDVRCLTASRDGRWLAVAGSGGAAVLEVGTWRVLAEVAAGPGTAATAVALAPDGFGWATGWCDGRVLLHRLP